MKIAILYSTVLHSIWLSSFFSAIKKSIFSTNVFLPCLQYYDMGTFDQENKQEETNVIIEKTSYSS